MSSIISSFIKRLANYTDQELIQLWQQGHLQAFDVLYERYYIKLVNIAWKKTGDPQIAQELAQDVFVALYKQLPKLKPEISLDGYLYISLRNRVFNHHRSLLVQEKRQHQSTYNLIPVRNTASCEPLEAKELELEINKKIHSLPPQCRTVFLLSREERLTNKQIAERLNISVNTVEQHMRKAIAFLRNSLDGYNNVAVCLTALIIESTHLLSSHFLDNHL